MMEVKRIAEKSESEIKYSLREESVQYSKRKGELTNIWYLVDALRVSPCDVCRLTASQRWCFQSR